MPHRTSNPMGADGATGLTQVLPHEEEAFKTSAAVSRGYVVTMNSSGLIQHAATDSTAATVVGIAAEDIASGETGLVTIRGICENVPAAGTVSDKDILKRSVTTTGFASTTATPADGESIGFAVGASGSNVVDVWLWSGRGGG